MAKDKGSRGTSSEIVESVLSSALQDGGTENETTGRTQEGTAYDTQTGEVAPSGNTALATTDRNSVAIQGAKLVDKKTGAVTQLSIGEREDLQQDDALDDLTAYAKGLGFTANEIEVVAGGNLPFWPTASGLVLCGIIESRREQTSRLRDRDGKPLEMAIYTLRITRERTIASTTAALKEGKVFWLEPGDHIQLIERKLMTEFAHRIGQEVIIQCVGQKQSRNNPDYYYWDYRIVAVGNKPSAAERSAGALESMAGTQRRLASGG